MDFEIKINDKLSVKLRNADDAKAFFDLVVKNREELRKWLPWVDATISPKDTEEFILRCGEDFKNKKSADFGVWYEDKWVGSMGYHQIDYANKKASIGYWLDKDHQGKGIITESVKAIIRYGFDELNLNRIEIECASTNLKSRAVAERLGFVFEGTLRENHIVNGIFYDGLLFSILRREWSE